MTQPKIQPPELNCGNSQSFGVEPSFADRAKGAWAKPEFCCPSGPEVSSRWGGVAWHLQNGPRDALAEMN